MFGQFPVLSLVALLVLMHAVTEFAWRTGRRRGAAREDTVPIEPATALLAVLGLLLAFTVSMAVDRFEQRKQLVVDEANAIGTAELRSHLLPDAARSHSRQAFEAYLDRRLHWGEAADDATQERLAREAVGYQRELWRIAADVGTAAPSPVFALYESALNDTFDVAAARENGRANRVPETVLLLLSVIAPLANGLFAAVLARNRKSRTFDLHILAFATWMVIALIVDLDRPRRGWVQVSQQPLVQLQESWRQTPQR